MCECMCVCVCVCKGSRVWMCECVHELKLLLKQFIFPFLQIQGKQMTKWAFLLGVVRDVPTLLRMLWPHVCSILLFLLFIVWNGSVALGDKIHHQAGLHLPQLFYFFAITCGFAATAMLSQIELIASFFESVS